jgi:aryl-alcohol dehydrogenase-like predicted oxidoreductase
VDIINLAKTFSLLVDSGKIQSIGSPIFTKPYRLIQWYYEAKLNGYNNISCQQVPFSLVSRSMLNSDLLDICKTLNLPIIGFGGLGGGILTGKYTSDKIFPEDGKQSFLKVHSEGKSDKLINELLDFCSEKDLLIHHVALAYVLHQENISSIIIGATKPDQLDDIMLSLEIKLSSEDIELLDEISSKYYLW